MFKSIPLATALIFSSSSVFAAEQPNWASCVAELQQKAKSEGLSQQTIDSTLANVKYVPRVIELDNKQPEFSQSFENYFTKRVTDWRVAQGRKLYKEHKVLLDKLAKQYGVPPQYLLAFWGLETNFGSYKGKMPVLDSLATLACDPRRSSYFTQELMQALKLKERYSFVASDMVGSWAGAMGHTQFMPSAYAKYAVDGDGDGKADLWNSTEDALTSAAHFLQNLGWKRNERWGREVTLPKDFSYEYLGKAQAQPLTRWAELGITQTSGSPLSTPDMQAALYLPSGHTGPAFLGYDNFDVIMRWNRSTFYAIAVGHLADRINGGMALKVAPPEMPSLSRARVKELQIQLNERGYDVGKPDGILGANSVKGLQAYQRSQGLVADGYPDEATFKSLGVK
ncbi:lytic murein transglycosylase [Shewanella fidelis]|uniref:Lytic murein transglycosylase n=1 Tax=Shewanella fidelis TaxID=173509 RepID=A0AAW8NMP4_9GAMM|nr:lytic murein transglycosylase [Shewanella fidelis]MDR8523640.1 lytic murein transglycosylase [Shewanella fidelis]MDW4810187.1 lytic murein transglycosylase [Shewanella fidelis]MDW4814332.1 lytic murein transglycosylase [Shewanella fidelis]MDW4818423.1 lytic murein transglycosylase [Shewanella fidelis]MDW4823925.1 lytic murein transglycosylase [Shewanella fidelis]